MKSTQQPSPDGARRMVRQGLRAAADRLTPGATGQIPRLTLRLQPGDGPAEVTAAVERALLSGQGRNR